MVLTEVLLYQLARLFARTEVALTSGMKSALASKHSCEQYRGSEIDKIRAALRRFEISLEGATVLDIGCNDGSLTSGYEAAGARSVIGVDLDATTLQRAEARPHSHPRVTV